MGRYLVIGASVEILLELVYENKMYICYIKEIYILPRNNELTNCDEKYYGRTPSRIVKKYLAYLEYVTSSLKLLRKLARKYKLITAMKKFNS